MAEFFTLTFIGLLMIISPGPDFAIVTKTSITNGRLAGFGSAVGIGLACACHVGLNLLGIGIIIAQSAMLFTIMKLLGAAYLIYIGFKGLRAKPSSMADVFSNRDDNNNTNSDAIGLDSGNTLLEIEEKIGEEARKSLNRQGFYSGFMTCLLNPKACLFFLSFFSVLLSPSTPLGTQIFYGAWLSLMALLWFSLVAIFFTNPIIGAKLKAYKYWIERLAGGALMILGIRLLGVEAMH